MLYTVRARHMRAVAGGHAWNCGAATGACTARAAVSTVYAADALPAVARLLDAVAAYVMPSRFVFEKHRRTRRTGRSCTTFRTFSDDRRRRRADRAALCSRSCVGGTAASRRVSSVGCRRRRAAPTCSRPALWRACPWCSPARDRRRRRLREPRPALCGGAGSIRGLPQRGRNCLGAGGGRRMCAPAVPLA